MPCWAKWIWPSLVAAMIAPSLRSNWQAAIAVACAGGGGSLSQVDQSIVPSWASRRELCQMLPSSRLAASDVHAISVIDRPAVFSGKARQRNSRMPAHQNLHWRESAVAASRTDSVLAHMEAAITLNRPVAGVFSGVAARLDQMTPSASRT
jgi:hypothetical protein